MYNYLIIINIFSFFLMGFDKHQAIYKNYRIPETALIILSFLGAGIGILISMIIFHHKTRKLKFIFFIPLSIILYILLLIY